MARSAAIAFLFALAVWGFCAAIMAIGPQLVSLDTTLVVHAIGGPLGAAVAAWIYVRRFGGISPLATAFAFVAVALALDVFVVSLLVMHNFEMFKSALGLWIPMTLIFFAAWLAGTAATRQRHSARRQAN